MMKRIWTVLIVLGSCIGGCKKAPATLIEYGRIRLAVRGRLVGRPPARAPGGAPTTSPSPATAPSRGGEGLAELRIEAELLRPHQGLSLVGLDLWLGAKEIVRPVQVADATPGPQNVGAGACGGAGARGPTGRGGDSASQSSSGHHSQGTRKVGLRSGAPPGAGRGDPVVRLEVAFRHPALWDRLARSYVLVTVQLTDGEEDKAAAQQILIPIQVGPDPQPPPVPPPKNTVTMETVLSNGQTVVIGGLLKEVDDPARQVPFLSDIPLVSRLFSHRATPRDDQSLLILVTPRIIIREE